MPNSGFESVLARTIPNAIVPKALNSLAGPDFNNSPTRFRVRNPVGPRVSFAGPGLGFVTLVLDAICKACSKLELVNSLQRPTLVSHDQTTADCSATTLIAWSGKNRRRSLLLGKAAVRFFVLIAKLMRQSPHGFLNYAASTGRNLSCFSITNQTHFLISLQCEF